MGTEVRMPKGSDNMEEGTVLSWKRKAGDAVARGEVICEIEVEKAVIGVEAPVTGTLARVIAAEGETVPVGAVIGFIE